MSRRREARRLGRLLRAGRIVRDDDFDSFLPPALHTVAASYWTPLTVVRLAALWLRDIEARTVVDVGSGAGKFCVAAALLTRCQISGVEERASLVNAAHALAAAFGVDDRVTFVQGNVEAAGTLGPDVYYFFNPFGQYVFRSPEFDDPEVTFDTDRRQQALETTTALLARAPSGTFVITYNGFGARLPPTYEQLAVARHLPGTLRLWKQR